MDSIYVVGFNECNESWNVEVGGGGRNRERVGGMKTVRCVARRVKGVGFNIEFASRGKDTDCDFASINSQWLGLILLLTTLTCLFAMRSRLIGRNSGRDASILQGVLYTE